MIDLQIELSCVDEFCTRCATGEGVKLLGDLIAHSTRYWGEMSSCRSAVSPAPGSPVALPRELPHPVV